MKYTHVSSELIQQVVKLSREKKNDVEIGSILGIKPVTVRYIRGKRGIKGFPGRVKSKCFDDTAEKLRLVQFELEQTTEDRNRYAKLYDSEANKSKESERILVKLWIAIACASGCAIFFGTIVACMFAKL